MYVCMSVRDRFTVEVYKCYVSLCTPLPRALFVIKTTRSQGGHLSQDLLYGREIMQDDRRLLH